MRKSTALAQPLLLGHNQLQITARSLVRITFLPVVLIVALFLGTAFGTVSIPPGEIAQILLYKLGLWYGHRTWSVSDEAIIWQIRLPQVLAAGLVGASLGIAGTLFQAVLRNPLADPYVIGTSAGAQLGVSVALLLPFQIAFQGFGTVQILAFAGALATILFVYSLARSGGRVPVVALLLAGFVVSSFLISATSFLTIFGGRFASIMTWAMGGVEVAGMDQLAITGPLILLAGAVAYFVAPQLDVILLGEEQAAHLGIRVEALKLGVIVLAAFLTALAVSLAGIVAFVGLVVPHAIRMIYGPGHRLLVPATAAGGAAFLMVANLIAYVALPPTVIPLGAITAIIGAPLFLHLLRRSRREYSI